MRRFIEIEIRPEFPEFYICWQHGRQYIDAVQLPYVLWLSLKAETTSIKITNVKTQQKIRLLANQNIRIKNLYLEKPEEFGFYKAKINDIEIKINQEDTVPCV